MALHASAIQQQLTQLQQQVEQLQSMQAATNTITVPINAGTHTVLAGGLAGQGISLSQFQVGATTPKMACTGQYGKITMTLLSVPYIHTQCVGCF